MSWFGEVYRSAVGKKAVMAVTGIILFGFVLLHMVGNLKLYEGPKMLNSYAGFLRTVGSPAIPTSGLLWLVRGILLVAVVLHMWAAWQVTRLSRVARPHAYARRGVVQASYASRTMRWGGVIILLFVVYHLLDLTFGRLNPSFRLLPTGEPDVYHNVVASFSVWWVAAFYVVAQVALGFHLYHGMWSLFQSLGWNHPRFNRWRRGFATAFAWIITVGNISFPLAVLSRLIS